MHKRGSGSASRGSRIRYFNPSVVVEHRRVHNYDYVGFPLSQISPIERVAVHIVVHKIVEHDLIKYVVIKYEQCAAFGNIENVSA